jgi:hypothetical protein
MKNLFKREITQISKKRNEVCKYYYELLELIFNIIILKYFHYLSPTTCYN